MEFNPNDINDTNIIEPFHRVPHMKSDKKNQSQLTRCSYTDTISALIRKQQGVRVDKIGFKDVDKKMILTPSNQYNPLKDEWLLVSPHRALRPWSGQVETSAAEVVPKFDPTNPLCPGVTRASGIVTPEYDSTYVFTNDFPALLEEGPEPAESDDPLFQIKTAKGTCKVMCYHPHTNVYFTSLCTKDIIAIIDEWINQINELGKTFTWITQKRNCKKRERIVFENEEWLVVIPYWAIWPFETMVLPKRQIERFTDVDDSQKLALANTLRIVVAKYDNLFKCNFPYSMGWHGAPTAEKLKESQPHWTFHGIYLPPLLRSATVKKFMVGYELLAQSQRDLTAEKAAGLLREQPNIRFS
ncbi:hypothetical protein NQ314_007388 [Rhamnusium bicolor]|uniref:Probable galactose-1-phosphate uridylyltransferase n=1 Tax=Rhamnusium bicolor TaxID=1586634 RepID=A0AAV8YPF6_9CUCU|nr:hypothetical protein NQ314_007388 [Rhamnusium bicolor]